MKNRVILISLGFLIILGLLFIFSSKLNDYKIEKQKELPKAEQKTPILKKELKIIYPIADFEKRITKKPFGIYITPQGSPVQPERFSGYHNAVDVEYGDIPSDVPIYAIYDGEIVLKDWISGYGGVIVLKVNINDEELYMLYGHLSPQSFTTSTWVEKGQQIAVLGQGNTQETDSERRHLHFAIKKGSLDLRGYVQNQEELSNWYNPLEFYKLINQN